MSIVLADVLQIMTNFLDFLNLRVIRESHLIPFLPAVDGSDRRGMNYFNTKFLKD